MAIHNLEKPYQCTACRRSFSSIAAFNTHVETQKGACQDMKCFSYKGRSYVLTNGMKMQSGEKRVVENSSKNPADMSTCAGDKPNEWSECGKSFSDSDNLVSHMKTHTEEKPSEHKRIQAEEKLDQGTECEKVYQCSECAKSFARNRHLTEHMKTHSEKKPHVCGECGKCFVQSSAFAIHMRIHNSLRKADTLINNR